MSRDLFLAFDIGGSKALAALVGPRGRVLERGKARLPKGIGRRDLFALVRGLGRGLLGGPAGARRLRAVGAGVPGIVDAAAGRVLAAPNVDLSGFPIGPRLRKAFGRPVAVGNDVNLAILGEQWLGAARGKRDVVGVFPGTGIGGGVIVDGRMLLGAHGAGAEIGHITALPGGPRCGCGNRGCLEALAGRRAIERGIRRAVRAGERSAVRKLNGGRLKVIRSKVLRKALKRGDPVVVRVMREACEALGAACVSLRHVFDPEVFVLGGGLVEACGGFMLPIVRRAIRRDPFFSRVGPCGVVPSELGDDAVVLGAAALARGGRRR